MGKMNRNSLLALATLIALLWIESGDCKMQNDHEVDTAKRQQQQVVELKEWKNATPEPTCVKLRDCQAKEWEKKKKEGTLQVPYNVMEFDNRLAKCGGVTPLKYQTWWKKVCTMGWRAEAEMADEDEADEDEDEEGGRRTATLGDIKIAVSCDTEWYRMGKHIMNCYFNFFLIKRLIWVWIFR